MITEDISTAIHRYRQNNLGNSPTTVAMDIDTADRLRIALNGQIVKKSDKIKKAEQLFGGRIFGLLIERWPGNEKGFAVR